MIPTAQFRAPYLLVALVVAAGLAVVTDSLLRTLADPPGFEWVLLAALTLLTGSFTVKLPSVSAKLSVSETFVFTSVLLFGPSAGTLTVVVDALVISLWMNRARRRPLRVLFNFTAPAIALRLSSETFFAISSTSPGPIDRSSVGPLILPVFAFAFLYFLVNTWLVAIAVGAERGEPARTIWRTNFPTVSISYFVGSSIALLIVAYTDRIDLTVVSIIVPLLIISHLTFKASMGRLEDANRHIGQLHDLYLSTVETLAMAVDAKDQITHGHIRRVQVYAVELARRLGVHDHEQLKAIEAAALLHDMGKLAIPEHILNKPGKLSAVEFGKMKRHADLGADLLSSIKFPYPIIPIVRYHHENWDGTGYPSGLSRTDIPLGARILSVVDCFDALTSDRPYRARLSNDDALDILRTRRGSMYDPLVVDAFINAFPDIGPKAVTAGQQARSLMTAFREAGKEPSADVDDTRLSTDHNNLALAGTVAQRLRNGLTHLSCGHRVAVCALFQHFADTETVRCIGATGANSNRLLSLEIEVGERITGWTAANNSPMVNAPAVLDLMDLVDTFRPTLQSALSLPIRANGQVIGVVTAYASGENAFQDVDLREFEQFATELGPDLFISDSRHSIAVSA